MSEIMLKAQIGDKVSYDLNNLIISRSLNTVVQTCSFSLPWEGPYKNIRKWDVLKIYLKEDDKETLMFNGYVDDASLQLGKNTVDYKLNGKDIMGLAESRNSFVSVGSGMLSELIQRAINFSKIPVEVKYNMKTDIAVQVATKKNILELIKEIKEKYAVWIFCNREGDLVVTQPSYLHDDRTTVWNLTFGKDIIDVKINSLFSDINTVVVVGNGEDEAAIGVAVDMLGVQLAGYYSYEVIYRNDLFGQEQCQEVARDILIKRASNYSVSLSIPLNIEMEVGDSVRINIANDVEVNPEPYIYPDAIYRIKSLKHEVSKTSLKTNLDLYLHSIPDLPNRIVNRDVGILDPDTLEIVR